MEEKELQEALKKEEDLKAYFRQLKAWRLPFPEVWIPPIF